MPDRELLIRRYADILPPETDDGLLQVVSELDAASQPYRQLNSPPALDRLGDQLSRQYPRAALDGSPIFATRDRPSDVPEQGRTAEPIPLEARRPRHWWFRQGLGMVAAILVLVLVGGTLALVLQNHGGQGGGMPGGGSGAGATPKLPLTVTAAGIPITLESIDVSSSSTRLTFTARLPSDAVPVDASEVVILFPGDLQAEGITTNPRELDMGGVPHDAGQPTDTFSMTLGPVVQPDQGATLTFRRIRLQLAPTNQRTIAGPWVFRITPAMLGAEAQPLPTPNRFGSYTNLSLARAQRLVDFSIVEPEPLPAELTSSDFSLTAAQVGSAGAAKANLVTITYQARDPAEKGMFVEESTSSKIVPTVERDTLHLLNGPGKGKPTTIALDDSSHSTVLIQGVKVNRLATQQQGTSVLYYSWEQSGTYFVISTIPGREVTDTVIQQFVASMIAPAGPNATPVSEATSLPAGFPTPDASGTYRNLTFAQAKRLTPFHLAQPSWVPPSLKSHQIDVLVPPGREAANVILTYGSAPVPWHNLRIEEYGVRFVAAFPGNPVPVDLTIAGHVVTRVVYTMDSGTYTVFQWKDHGTTFLLQSQIDAPLTEQDVEHMIASMLGSTGATATPAAAAPNGQGASTDAGSSATNPKSESSGGGTSALWWVLWIGLPLGLIAVCAWLVNRLDGGDGPGDGGSTGRHIDEVDVHSRLIP